MLNVMVLHCNALHVFIVMCNAMNVALQVMVMQCITFQNLVALQGITLHYYVLHKN